MKTKILNWLTALLLCAAMIWTVLSIRPRPTVQANTAPVLTATPVPSVRPAQTPMTTLPPMSAPPVAQGVAPMPPQKYLDDLAARYRQRGYQQIELRQVLTPHGNRWPQARGVFWREGNLLVGAGVNANPHVNRSQAQAVYMTIVQTVADGTSWATYEKRPRQASHDLPEAAVLDLTGMDPPGIPRAPGAQRMMSVRNGANTMVAYTSAAPIAELIGYYEEQFRQLDWVLEPITTAKLRETTPGVFCFVTQGRVCLVWLQRESDTGPTTILISVDGI